MQIFSLHAAVFSDVMPWSKLELHYPSKTMLPIYQISQHHIPPDKSSETILTHESE